MSRMILRVAASTLAVGAMIAVSNPAQGGASKPASEAAKLAAKAERSLDKHRAADAVADAERAVALAPGEARYRLLLGQAYLGAGRFASAETSFADVLQLSPSEPRAAVSLVLAQIALGKIDAAHETLGRYSDLIGAADEGLAVALAGDPQAGVAILEQAARQPGSTARVRQNLALSYALAGRWREAKLAAMLDMSPNDVPRRLAEWALFVEAKSPRDQVASLLGVTPAADPGQPAMLALAPQAAAEPVAVAEAAPPPPPLRMAEEPAKVAAIEPPVAPVVDLTAYEGVRFAAPGEVVQPLPAAPTASWTKPVAWTSAPVETPRLIRKPAAKPAPARLVPASLVRDGAFVVQLGAFSAPDRVELGWSRAVERFAGLGDFTPSSTTFAPQPGGKTLYRLSVGGFASRADAVALCEKLQARGGACFVRATAGDAVPQWAMKARKQQLASR